MPEYETKEEEKYYRYGRTYKQVNFTLDIETIAKLKKASYEFEQSQSRIAETAIDEYITKLEIEKEVNAEEK